MQSYTVRHNDKTTTDRAWEIVDRAGRVVGAFWDQGYAEEMAGELEAEDAAVWA